MSMWWATFILSGFFSLQPRVQTGFGGHQVPYPMGTEVSFPGGKAAGAWNTVHLHQVSGVKNAWSSTRQYVLMVFCSVKHRDNYTCPCALIKHQAMKSYWGSGGIALRILDLDTRWEWSASRPGRFTPRERAPVTHWIWGWVGSIASLDAVVKWEILTSCRESNSRSSSP
jgi:hypothetical protein